MSKPGHRERSSMPDKTDLEPDEKEQADEYSNVPTSVIFEAIRREGEHELSRPASALWWSGVAAGLAISTSVVAKGFLASILPPCRVGGGHLESRLHGGLPDRHPRPDAAFHREHDHADPAAVPRADAGQDRQIARMWGIVFAANLVGCLAAALVLVHGQILPEANALRASSTSRAIMQRQRRSSISPGVSRRAFSSRRWSGSCRAWKARARC